MRRLRKLWQDVVTELEAKVLAWILRSALERHKPAMIDRWEHQNPVGGMWPDPMFAEPWCLACVAHWPCTGGVLVAVSSTGACGTPTRLPLRTPGAPRE